MNKIRLDEHFVEPHEKKPVELYLLTCDGIPRDDPYGSWFYCIGVYPTEFEAMQNANELPKDLDWEITPIILGETYPLHGGPYSYKNEKELGGYAE